MSWHAKDFSWEPDACAGVRLSQEQTTGPQAPSGTSAEGQGSHRTLQGGSESSDAAGARTDRTRSLGKKGRRSGRAPTICQVEGCGVNLQSGKPFYRLQRICEPHARAAVITDASGASLRFCQQCTRLHPVEEFDGAKRSCVASLQRRMARKQRQQAQESGALDAAEAAEAAAKRQTRVRTVKSRTRAAGSGGGVGPDSGSAPYDWSSNSHGSASYGNAHSLLSGGSGGASGGQGPLPLGAQAVDLSGVPGMVPQPLPHSRAMAAPPLQPQFMAAGASLPAPQLQPAGAAASQLDPFEMGHQPPATAAMTAPTSMMEWAEPHGLLSPGAVQQLLQDDGMLGDSSAALPPARLPPAPAARLPLAAGPSAAHDQSILADEEIDRLLVMDPDDLACALLAASDAGVGWPAQQGSEAGLTSSFPAGSVSGASGNTTAIGVSSGMSAPQWPSPPSGLGALGLPAGSIASAVPIPPALAPQTAGQWAGPDQLRQGVLGLALSSPPKSEPTAGAAMPRQPAATSAMPVSTTAAMQSIQLPPSSLPLSNWAGAQPAAALLNVAAAPPEQAVGAALGLPPEAELVVIRFALKVYGVYPDQLPPQLQVELQEAMTLFPTVLCGAVRNGCTHLTASLLLTGQEAAALDKPDGAALPLARLLRSWKGGAGRPAWRLPPELPLLRVVAQAEAASAALLLHPLQAAAGDGSGRLLAAKGGAICPLACSLADERLQLSLAGPPATTISGARGLFRLRCADWQQLLLAGEQPEAAAAGSSRSGGGGRRVLHCRARGRHVAVSLLWPVQPELDGQESSESSLPHTPVVSSLRSTPPCDEERPIAAATLLQQLAQQQLPQQPAMSAEQEGLEEGSTASSPAVSEPESDSETEAADEALTLRMLRASTSAEAWVPQALRQWGLYEFELAQGSRLGPVVPVLVLPDSMAAVAAEVCQLAAAEVQHPGVTARVLRLLSFVLLHLERQRQLGPLAPSPPSAGARALPPTALARLATSARWLCALCVRCRWPALLRALLPATTAGGAAVSEAVAAMDRLLPAGLLASAAASGSAELLQAMGDWGVAAGHSWQPAEGASDGMTALHYAAALGPRLTAEAAAALLATVGTAELTQCWLQAQAFGWTPRMVADATSNQVLIDLLDPLAAADVAEGQPPAHEPLAAAAASSSGGFALTQCGKAAKASAAEAEADEVAAQLLQEQFQALELEKGGGKAGRAGALTATDPLTGLPHLPAAEQKRPLSPALLGMVGAATILIVVGLSAALRAGLYD